MTLILGYSQLFLWKSNLDVSNNGLVYSYNSNDSTYPSSLDLFVGCIHTAENRAGDCDSRTGWPYFSVCYLLQRNILRPHKRWNGVHKRSLWWDNGKTFCSLVKLIGHWQDSSITIYTRRIQKNRCNITTRYQYPKCAYGGPYSKLNPF